MVGQRQQGTGSRPKMGREHALSALHELSCCIARGDDLPALFARLSHTLVSVLGVECCVALVREDAGALSDQGFRHGFPAQAPPRLNVPYDPVGDPLQRVVCAGQTLRCDDLAAETSRLGEALLEAGARSALATRVHCGDETIGLLLACDRSVGRPFGDRDCRLIETFATQFALAIHAARMQSTSRREREELELRARRAQVVARISEVTAQSLDLEQMLWTVADLTTRELGADMLLIWLAEEDREALRLAAHHNCPPELVTLVGALRPEARSVAGLAIRSGRVQVVADVAALGADFPVTHVTAAAGGFRSLVAVPLMAQGTLVGELTYMLRAAHHFSPEEVEVIATIGHQFAVAIRNAQLYEKTRQANRQLLLSNLRLQALIKQLPEGVAVADQSGKIVLCNRAAAGIAGRSLPAARAIHHADFFHFCQPDGRPAPPEATPIARVLRTGEAVTGEQWRYEREGAGEESHLLVNCAPLHDAAGAPAGAVVICQDITELRRVERLKDQFLAIASHELRTPLTSIKGYTQAILSRLEQRLAGFTALDGGPDCRVECHRDRMQLQVALRQINRLNVLIGDLLDVSRLEGGRLDLNLAPVDIVALARAVADRLQETTNRHQIVVEAEAAPPPEELRGDEDRLDQVFTNLMQNAIKYSPEGGSILIDVRVARSIREDKQGLPDLPPGGSAWVVVRVKDQGVGIPADQLERIFERFYRASNALARSFGGLGLGLHISREIVTRHGGTIWVESEEQRGSSFYFALPIVAAGMSG